MNRRKLLAISLAAAACRRFRAGKKLRIATYPTLSMGGLHLAAESGWFKKAGLEVEVQEIVSVAESVLLLAGGRLDVWIGGMSVALINAVARGVSIRIVAAHEKTVPGCGAFSTLYGRRSDFPGGRVIPAQLRGKRVALSGRRQLGEFALDSILARAEMKSEDVRLVELRPPDGVAALLSGGVDAVLYPQTDKDIAAVSGRIVPGPGLADVLPGFQFSFVMFGRSFLEAGLQPGAGFLRLHFRGNREYLAGKTPRRLEDVARAARMDIGSIREACRATVSPDGALDVDSIERFTGWAVAKGYSPARPEVSQLTDFRYLEEAGREI